MTITESIVCRTERANPAHSIALKLKGFDRICSKNEGCQQILYLIY